MRILRIHRALLGSEVLLLSVRLLGSELLLRGHQRRFLRRNVRRRCSFHEASALGWFGLDQRDDGGRRTLFHFFQVVPVVLFYCLERAVDLGHNHLPTILVLPHNSRQNIATHLNRETRAMSLPTRKVPNHQCLLFNNSESSPISLTRLISLPLIGSISTDSMPFGKAAGLKLVIRARWL